MRNSRLENSGQAGASVRGLNASVAQVHDTPLARIMLLDRRPYASKRVRLKHAENGLSSVMKASPPTQFLPNLISIVSVLAMRASQYYEIDLWTYYAYPEYAFRVGGRRRACLISNCFGRQAQRLSPMPMNYHRGASYEGSAPALYRVSGIYSALRQFRSAYITGWWLKDFCANSRAMATGMGGYSALCAPLRII